MTHLRSSLSVVVVLLGLHCLAARPPQQDAAALAASDGDIVEPPEFPSSYQVKYNFSLPYTKKVQPHGLRYPVFFWRDSVSNRVRLDTYDGMTSMILKKGVEYEVVPRINEQRCFIFKTDDDEPTANGRHLLQALPDVRGWAFMGEENLNGVQARLWQYDQRHEGKHTQYKLYVAADGAPIRLHMHGNELFDGSHFDEWVADYYDYLPGRPDPEVFSTPKLCEGAEERRVEASLRASAPGLRMRLLLPTVMYAGDAAYDAFLASHGAGRQLASLTEYHLRAELYRANAELVAVHNAANHTFTLKMNRFGDWTREEFMALMLPNRARKAEYEGEDAAAHRVDPAKAYELPHKPLTDPSRVPRTVSWQGTGADAAVVKDQANCGSCWAFGATGAMEASWFMATGQQASFSEQQLMDCSWDFGYNSACDGGDAAPAIAYAAAAGGIAALRDYEYLGQDGYCKAADAKKAARFKGYARVPRFNNELVMEAVYSRGPLAISIDASQPTFTFYSDGVYYDPSCAYRVADLDHAVMLLGYGTDEKAGDYWLVRNSWSDLWGDNGYIKISRDNFGCGVPTDAVYAVVDEEAL